jgi:hypothetical protein
MSSNTLSPTQQTRVTQKEKEMSKREIQTECYDCMEIIWVEDIGKYSYQGICPECKEARRVKWEKMLATQQKEKETNG